MKKYFRSINICQSCLIIILFLTCLYGAIQLDSSNAPDESVRMQLTDYIYNNQKLPLGNEPEIQIEGWGFSYATRPYLTSIIGAIFEGICGLFTASPHAKLVAARLVSVIAVTLCGVYVFKIGNGYFCKKTSATLFGVLICFMPQVIYLGMYFNNDAPSLLCVAMVIYYLIRGIDTCWDFKSCLLFAFSISVSLLTYYSIYPWILVVGVFFLYSMFRYEKVGYSMAARRVMIISALVVLMAGWFFIRNAYIFDGDILGMKTEEASMRAYVENGGELKWIDCPKSYGMTFVVFITTIFRKWIVLTVKSFIGVFGYMNIYLDSYLYRLYVLFILIGLALGLAMLIMYGNTKTRERFLMLFFASIITVALSIYQSYARDFQAQGRYIISAIFPLAYLISYGYDVITILIHNKMKKDCLKRIIDVSRFIGIAWMGMFVYVFFNYITIVI